jgi:hypothetical protein
MKIKSNIINLSIAGFHIRLIFKDTELLFAKNKLIEGITIVHKGFIIHGKNGTPDFTISFVDRKINDFLHIENGNKYFINLFEEISNSKISCFYHIDLMQVQLIIRYAIAKLSEKHNVFFLHSSAVGLNGKVYIFLGHQGAGKSTTANLLVGKHVLLADDVSIIRKEGGKYYFYQTPFIERERMERDSKKHIIKGVFFLRKRNFFSLEKIIDKDYILPKTIKQLFANNPGNKNIQAKYVIDFVNQSDFFYLLSFAKRKKDLNDLFASEFEKNI